MVSGFLLLRAFGFFSVNGLPACGTDNATRTKRSNGGKNHDTIRKMRLGLVLIYVKDLDRMAAFYGEILGLQAIESTRTESWVEFEAGGIRFGLHAIPAAIAEGIEIASPPRAREDNDASRRLHERVRRRWRNVPARLYGTRGRVCDAACGNAVDGDSCWERGWPAHLHCMPADARHARERSHGGSNGNSERR